MKPLQLWYLATIIFFTGLGAYIFWSGRKNFLKQHWKFILAYALFTIPWAYWDAIALRWKAYQYNPEHVLNIRVFGGQLETYIFMALVGVVVCSATLVYMKQEEKSQLKLRYLSNSKKRRRHKRQKFFAVAAGPKRLRRRRA